MQSHNVSYYFNTGIVIFFILGDKWPGDWHRQHLNHILMVNVVMFSKDLNLW